MGKDPRVRDNVQVGIIVKIAIKKKDPPEKFVEGTVKEIISEVEYDEHGIEVELDSGYMGFIKEIMSNNDFITEMELKRLIEKHETYKFEMKSSFRYDIKLSEKLAKSIIGEYLRRKIVEEVASFMNCDGGIVCIGVSDNKEILGLEKDYSTFPPSKDPQDELRNQIKQALIDYLDDNIIHSLFRIEFLNVENNRKDVCLICVEKSPSPIFVKLKNVSCRLDDKDKSMDIWKCWVRSDNGIREIDFSSFMKHWEMKNNSSVI